MSSQELGAACQDPLEPDSCHEPSSQELAAACQDPLEPHVRQAGVHAAQVASGLCFIFFKVVVGGI